MISNLKGKLRAMKSNSPSDKKEAVPKWDTESEEISDNKGGSFGGSIVSGDGGEFVWKRTVYGYEKSYGRINLSDLRTAAFGDSQWWTRLDRDLCPEDIVFLDTETTGLAGGTGTVAFLVGLGGIEEDGLVVDQYLMRDFDEEIPMLQAVMDRLKRYSILVTFNGKSFDWPLLECRLITSRLRPMDWEDAHLDLLPVARRLWGIRLENCSLSTLEEKILFQRRIDDIPGPMIPNIYLDYLQTRRSDEMRRVIRHNEWDIAAMAALLVHIAGLYHDPQNRGDAYELFGIAKELERDHRIREAAACYKACIGSAPHPLVLDAKKRFAYLTKRHRGPQEAMDLWADLAGEEGSFLAFPLIEMAKCLEHREKDYPSALECTEKAIRLVGKIHGTGSERLKEELFNRRQRLMKKMERRMEQWG